MSLNATQVRVEVSLQYIGYYRVYHGSHGNPVGVESTILCFLGNGKVHVTYLVKMRKNENTTFFICCPQQANCTVFTQQYFSDYSAYSADERGNSSDSAFVFLLLISGCFITILFDSLCNLPATCVMLSMIKTATGAMRNL